MITQGTIVELLKSDGECKWGMRVTPDWPKAFSPLPVLCVMILEEPEADVADGKGIGLYMPVFSVDFWVASINDLTLAEEIKSEIDVKMKSLNALVHRKAQHKNQDGQMDHYSLTYKVSGG